MAGRANTELLAQWSLHQNTGDPKWFLLILPLFLWILARAGSVRYNGPT
jgi:hypothetical protein